MNGNSNNLLTKRPDDDPLGALLRDADATFSESPHAISPQALLAAARRRRVRAAGRGALAGSAAVAFILAAWALAPNSVPPIHKTSHHIPAPSPTDWSLQQPVPLPNPDQLRAELSQLDHEADLAQRIVHAVLAQPALDNEVPLASELPDADLVRLESARSAAIAWQYANVVEHELHDPAAARLEYQRLVDRFPGTQWADLAATSLRRP